jgi:hypothetical protein
MLGSERFARMCTLGLALQFQRQHPLALTPVLTLLLYLVAKGTKAAKLLCISTLFGEENRFG